MTSHPAPGTLQHTLGQHRVVHMEAGRATIEYDAGQHMCHSGGVVQGGFISGWIDAAMAHAAISLTGRDTSPMSLEIKVSYFAPARPGRLIAEGWIERKGKVTCFAEGVLKDEKGTILAKASSTIRLIPLAKIEADTRAALA